MYKNWCLVILRLFYPFKNAKLVGTSISLPFCHVESFASFQLCFCIFLSVNFILVRNKAGSSWLLSSWQNLLQIFFKKNLSYTESIAFAIWSIHIVKFISNLVGWHLWNTVSTLKSFYRCKYTFKNMWKWAPDKFLIMPKW